jgi:hypothetical protein
VRHQASITGECFNVPECVGAVWLKVLTPEVLRCCLQCGRYIAEATHPGFRPLRGLHPGLLRVDPYGVFQGAYSRQLA